MIKVLIAGDFCPRYRTEKLFEVGDYSTVLGEIKPHLETVDYAILNFECPVCYSEEKPILKHGPNLKCSKRGVDAIKWAGFNCVTLANNHLLDYGEQGVENTIKVCQENGIDVVGCGKSLKEASAILYKKIKGKTLAIINCCEHEFSIATETTAGSNPLNPVQQYYGIVEAKEKADYILVIVHGGHEQYNLPSPRMQETYRFFVDVGADAVINHHQHCYSGYEIYKGKPIYYGIGNFCFDIKGEIPIGWTEGYMVVLSFDADSVKSSMIPYSQCGEKPVIKLLPIFAFKDELDRINNIIADEKQIIKHANNYYKEVYKSISYMLEPIQNRYISALQRRHILPSLLSKRWMIRFKNYVTCESHQEKLQYFINYYLQNEQVKCKEE